LQLTTYIAHISQQYIHIVMKKYKNLIEKQRELIFVYTTNFNYGSPYTDQLESEIAAIEKEIEEEEQPTDAQIKKR